MKALIPDNEAISTEALHQHQILDIEPEAAFDDLRRLAMMPSMDGQTTIRTLQKMNPQVKLIAMSGLPSNEQILKTARLGVQTFLSKPYTVKELLQTLHEVINS